jgi:hypothetical protein
MTCIVAIAEHGRVWMGADRSMTLDSGESMPRDIPKLFRLGDYLLGVAGSIRVEQVVRYAFTPPPPTQDDETGTYDAFMAVHFVDALRAALDGKLSEVADDRNDFVMLVGVGGALFMVLSDFAVSRLDVAACGCGDQIANGALFAAETLPPRERLAVALRAAARFHARVSGPFDFDEIGPERSL